MHVLHTHRPSSSARRFCRKWPRAALPIVLAVAGLWTALPASAQRDLSGTWRINGNGYVGDFAPFQRPGGDLGGTMYAGETISGFHSTDSRIAVVLRGPNFRPTQAYVGEVSADGTRWTGSFYALTLAMGATTTGNAFGFHAWRSGAPTAPVAPRLGAGAAPCLAPSFSFVNRPSEFPNDSYTLTLNNPAPPLGCITGEFSGTIAGDPVYGHYAPGTGSIVFMRMKGGSPAQFYTGWVRTPAAEPQRIAGSFYALTPEMGAGSVRMRYDWAAVSR